jgi:hypothetical protein
MGSRCQSDAAPATVLEKEKLFLKPDTSPKTMGDLSPLFNGAVGYHLGQCV